MSESATQTHWSRRLIVGLPYLWLLLFFLLPFAIVVKISLAEALIAVPPYSALLSRIDGQLQLTATLENYAFLLTDQLYVLAYLNSVKIAAVSTLLCLLLGFPMAWAIARSQPRTRNLLLLLVVMPSWTSFLIRVYAWMGILSNTGYLNNFLLWLGVIDDAAAAAAHRLCCLRRHRLHLPALHGAAALHQPGEVRLATRGGGQQSWRDALALLLADRAAAEPRRHHCRLHAGVHPGYR